ncbi:flagellin [Izhakiella australiensis]|uniref:Flagellin n=1 Tax=Izhakiella australiensis TaxID=1926881 RepID=A0A1S8YNX5_9GAMM|nr:FliC/FljB family flagellin [Izhakiella australiensis]OON40565.1 flagellin [Izhakiella australiensis]
MSQVINTNSLSLITQNNMNKSQSALGTAIERLSSGQRINSAKDDAAGQAIANRFTSNINGLSQAARNANDGISIAQTTEGSLSEINNNLQRIRELTVQAQNGTNNQSDLDSIQDEITSRLSEIDRVSGQTQFNGVKVLSADNTMKIQVGANDGETISIDLKAITSKTLGLTGFNVNGKGSVANAAATSDDLKLAGFAAAGSPNADGSTTYSKDFSYAGATAADVLAGAKDTNTITYTGTNTGLGVAAKTNTYTYDAASKSYSYAADGVSKDSVLSYLAPNAGDSFSAKVTIGGKAQDVNIAKDGTVTTTDGKALYLDVKGNLTQTGSGATTAATWDNLVANTDTSVTGSEAAVATKIEAKGVTIQSAGGGALTAGVATPANTVVDVTGVTVSAAQMGNAVKGQDFTLNDGGTAYGVTGSTGAVTKGGAAAYVDNNGAITTTAKETVNYYAQSNGNVTNNTGSAIYKTADGKLTTTAATTSAATSDPLASLDAAIGSIDKFRSSLGAIQNRLDSAITNLNNTTTNLSSAQSRIQDADYATEVSNMSKAQILQQAGNSVLAKANQVPQQVLSLLQG